MGEQLWERHPGGRPKKFETPEELRGECMAYFQWLDDNPLIEEKAFSAPDGIRYARLARMRAATLGGLCLYLGVSRATWGAYRQREEFLTVCEAVEEMLTEQKFTGASAGLLNAAIIARDLGLADKREVSGGFTVQVQDSFEEDEG